MKVANEYTKFIKEKWQNSFQLMQMHYALSEDELESIIEALKQSIKGNIEDWETQPRRTIQNCQIEDLNDAIFVILGIDIEEYINKNDFDDEDEAGYISACIEHNTRVLKDINFESRQKLETKLKELTSNLVALIERYSSDSSIIFDEFFELTQEGFDVDFLGFLRTYIVAQDQLLSVSRQALSKITPIYEFVRDYNIQEAA